MEYKIIKADDIRVGGKNALEKLEEQVNEAIEEGWRPIGGVAIHFDENIIKAMYQSLVKG